MKKTIFLGILLLWLNPVIAGAVSIDVRFSIDPASPSVAGTLTPDDVLRPGPAVVTQGTSLGLKDNFLAGNFDNLDGLSYGRDPVPRPPFKIPIFFSVDRVAIGVPGTDVFERAKPGVESAAGDVFVSVPINSTDFNRKNSLAITGNDLGLQSGFFGDDLNGLELDTINRVHIYFSVDSLSASNGFGTMTKASDIFIDAFATVFAVGGSATGSCAIGLLPQDDLDALALDDSFNPGHCDPGMDKALFSLSPFSPNTFTGGAGSLSPADILFTDFSGSFSLWASAESIGLRRGDNVDALDTTVPEPSSIFLMAIGFVCLAFYHYRFREKLLHSSAMLHEKG
jgi:hypothetical protein